MIPHYTPSGATSRRDFIATAGAAFAAATVPSTGFAQAAAKYHRVDLMKDKRAKKMLASYEKAIGVMLDLKPENPLNWYRQALIHTLDCPHMNWWLFPWHRGFVGYREQIIRELSGDPEFAFPYWDWTAYPHVPEQFFGTGVLNLTNPKYIQSYKEFKAQFNDPLSAFWKSLSADQLDQLKARQMSSEADFWSFVGPDKGPMFVDPTFPPSTGMNVVRRFTKTNPGLDNIAPYYTLKAVSQPTIDLGMSATSFDGTDTPGKAGFSTAASAQHSIMSKGDRGVIEASPHNMVHNDICGFMCDNMSPVDPLFFMHHSNIDRLWQVWIDKQVAAGKPTVPTDPTQLALWKKELFLFFTDIKGKPVTKVTSGDYIEIGDFNYDYPAPLKSKPFKPSGFANKLWQGTLAAKLPNLGQMAKAEVMLPEKLTAVAGQQEAPTTFARITLQAGADTKGVTFVVLVNPTVTDGKIDMNDNNVAGSFGTLGHDSAGHIDGEVTFTVPLGGALKSLSAANNLDAAKALNVHVVALRRGAEAEPVDLKVSAITVGAL